MSANKCFDSDGRLLKRLYQWDKNISVTITGVGEVIEPVFHMYNPESDSATVVTPTISGDSLIVQIPEFYLRTGSPVLAYLYTKTRDGGHRSIHTFYFPVMRRHRPDDYEFDDTTSGTTDN